jgi:hypothetical protein
MGNLTGGYVPASLVKTFAFEGLKKLRFEIIALIGNRPRRLVMTAESRGSNRDNSG